MVKALDRGVDDWVSKDHLGDLLPAVLRALRLAEERRLRRHAEAERDWLSKELSILRGRQQLSVIVPICSACKKIRTDRTEWVSLESYFDNKHGIRFSHGLCPGCVTNYRLAASLPPPPEG